MVCLKKWSCKKNYCVLRYQLYIKNQSGFFLEAQSLHSLIIILLWIPIIVLISKSISCYYLCTADICDLSTLKCYFRGGASRHLYPQKTLKC